STPPGAAGSDPAGAMAQAALAATHAAGINPRVVYVPRPSATPAQAAQAAAKDQVSPLYTGLPAPLGLADYGLSQGLGDTVVGSILNTTSLRGEVDANATGIQPLDLFQSSPDSYGIQLNAVVTNVTLFGTGGYSFWTQNVVTYYPGSSFMILITNVWNFSGGPLSSNVFYGHGPYGFQVGTTYYYSELVIPAPIVYPFNLSLFMNSTVTDGRNAVDFSVVVAGSGENYAFPSFDYVIFNSIAGGGPPITAPSNYTANGLHLNPLNLTDDFELILGGPGGGSQADLFAADASLALEYWNGTAYVSVPSAYNYGGETGETTTGASIAWSSAPGGPNNASTYATMTSGPAILRGLWNASAAEGSTPLTLSVTPTNAFDFILAETGGSANFIIPEFSYAPNVFTNTFYLTPGTTYNITIELSDYTPFNYIVSLGATPVTVSIALTFNSAFGLYTPLWAFSNSQVAALTSSGSGTVSSPYVLFNNQAGPIGSEFGLYNDYAFPVFPGVFLMDTSVVTELSHPSSFSTTTSTFAYPGKYLPSLNDLQMWFWNVSNVAIVDASNISGWFGSNTWYPVSFDTFNVVFYESSYNLIAGNTFDTQSQALLMFYGGSIFGPLNIGGGNNTVWGNTFNYVLPPAACPLTCLGLMPQVLSLGIEVAESYDLIYNNYVDTPTTAWLLPLNMYSGAPEFFTVSWNIPSEAAGIVNTVPDFPSIPLTGSIIGTSYQGGNFWFDYGIINPFNGANNPYGVLPYDENAPTLLVDVYGPSYYFATYIYPGGDMVPLFKNSLFEVTFEVSGLVALAPNWSGQVAHSSDILANFTTNSTSYMVLLPNGSYRFTVPSGPYRIAGSSGINFLVNGVATTVGVRLALGVGIVSLTFREQGLPPATDWTVTINGTSNATDPYNATETSSIGTMTFLAARGSFTYTVAPVAGETPNHPSGTVIVHRNTVVALRFTAYTYELTFTETGLKVGKSWKVTIGATSRSSPHSTIVFALPNGTYHYTIKPIPGYTTTWSGSAVISGASVSVPVTFVPVTYTLSFAETGLSASSAWAVLLVSVNFGPLNQTTTTAFDNFTVANGTYIYHISTPSGLRASPIHGSVHISGSSRTVNVRFTDPGGDPGGIPLLSSTVAAGTTRPAIQ
ncbi:MAG TPA: thermopsin family protease, partial [Thermoplasmata archaeon]|nr:thermopsin family protease [Thermoplasmata archaeon]